MELHDFQKDLSGRLTNEIENGRSPLLQLWTGAGKTIIVLDLVRKWLARNPGKRAVYITHRIELLNQVCEKAKMMGIEILKFHDSENNTSAEKLGKSSREKFIATTALTFLSVLKRRPRRSRMNFFADLLILDEAHHSPASTWSDICKRHANVPKIGLTATPKRLDGLGMQKFFTSIIEGPPMRNLIGDGYLADFNFIHQSAANRIRLSGAGAKKDDFSKKEVIRAVSRNMEKNVAETVRLYRENADGKKMIVYAVGVAHGNALAGAFRSANISHGLIHSNIPQKKRDAIVSDFHGGKINILINIEILTEGFDCPSAQGVIIARPTASTTLYFQMIGRALRPKKGKAIIIDQTDNFISLGLPTDKIIWSLEGKVNIEDMKKYQKFRKSKTDMKIMNFGEISEETEHEAAGQGIGMSCPSCGAELELGLARKNAG